MTIRDQALWREQDPEHRESEVKEIAVVPANLHGHMSYLYSSVWVVYEDGKRTALMVNIPTAEAEEYAENLRDTLKEIRRRNEQI